MEDPREFDEFEEFAAYELQVPKHAKDRLHNRIDELVVDKVADDPYELGAIVAAEARKQTVEVLRDFYRLVKYGEVPF